MAKTYKIRQQVGTIMTHLTTEDKTLVRDVLQRLQGDHLWGLLLGTPVWYNGNTTRGGCFRYRRDAIGQITPVRIELHPAMFDEDFPERAAEGRETFLHEIAHFITAACLRGKGHGSDWKRVMRMLRLPATRCHDLDYVKSTRKQSVYACQRCPKTYSFGRKLKNDGVYHRCGICKVGKLMFVSAPAFA